MAPLTVEDAPVAVKRVCSVSSTVTIGVLHNAVELA